MEERKGDARIYLVIALFFACLISGGVLLGLYMFLPVNNVKSWYPIAGLTFVGIPWAFWFLTCIYRCIRPPDYLRYNAPCKSPVGSPLSRARGTALMSPRNPPLDDESQGHSPHGARHVHFGGVVMITDDANGDRDERTCSIDQHPDQIKLEEDNSVDHSKESVMPLAFFVDPPSTS